MFWKHRQMFCDAHTSLAASSPIQDAAETMNTRPVLETQIVNRAGDLGIFQERHQQDEHTNRVQSFCNQSHSLCSGMSLQL